MGRIFQKGESLYLTPKERKSLNVTQWRFISPRKGALEVCINYDVYSIFKISMTRFHEINSRNLTVKISYEFRRSTLMCSRCGGSGIVDWVDRALKGSIREMTGVEKNRYIRHKGPIKILKNYLGRSMYISRQKLRKGEGLCPDCHGGGIQIQQFTELSGEAILANS